MSSSKAIRLTAQPSPITTDVVALSRVSFSDLQINPQIDSIDDDRLYLSCLHPSRQGKACVQSVSLKDYHSSFASETLAAESAATVTNLSHNVRSAVHEYGGGPFCVVPNSMGGGVVYTDFPSHTVYWQKENIDDELGARLQLFPREGQTSACRFADFSIVTSANEQPPVILAVMEDHTDSRPSKVTNSIVTLSMDGQGTVTSLASGLDFYSSPTISGSDKRRLAFVGWNHPNMPWDDTTLYVQSLSADDLRSSGAPPRAVPHSANDDFSVYAPQWFENKLYFLSDVTGWYNLYAMEELSDGDSMSVTPLLPKQDDFAEASCGWKLGVKCFTIMSNGILAAKYDSSSLTMSCLVLLDLNDPDSTAKEFYGSQAGLPPSIRCLAAHGNMLYFMGSSTKDPPSVWCWEHPGDTSRPPVRIITSTNDPDMLSTITPFFSQPRPIQYSSNNQGAGYAHAYFYPPTNLNPDLLSADPSTSDILPPLLVKAHGGPTARTSTSFRVDIQFWTSRGFAVLDVDYGGSTGYGKAYRESLKGRWGVVDLADVCAGAQYCAEQQWVNKDWLCIDGGSAGGYTTLAALTFRDVFSAGACLYGIGDLTALTQETHKFESRYTDGLLGPYPEEKAVYDERSPVHYTDQLSCPVILLQGDEDKVVPPSQAEQMFDVLQKKGLPSALVMYKGEQHGFRKGANIRHALLSEYFFFCQTFGIEPQRELDFEGVRIGERVEV